MTSDLPNPSSTAIRDSYTDPLFLGGTDHSSLVLVTDRLTGAGDFNSWHQSMLLALNGRNKLGFVDGTVPKPADGSPDSVTWSRCNDVVKSWLINSVSKTISQSILHVKTAEEIWSNLLKRFQQSNVPRLYQVEQSLQLLPPINFVAKFVHSSNRVLVHDKLIRARLWSHNESWMVSGDETDADNTYSEIRRIGGRNNRERHKPNQLKRDAEAERKREAEARRQAQAQQVAAAEEPIPLRDFGDGSTVTLDCEHGYETLFGPILKQTENDCWALVLRAILQFMVNRGRVPEQRVALDTQGLIRSLKDKNVELSVGSLNGAIRYIRNVGLEKEDSSSKGPCIFRKDGDFQVKYDASEEEIIGLLEKGPVAITIDDHPEFRDLLPNEIYHVKERNERDNWTMRHVIMITGCGQLEDGRKFFIVRNTWGPKWGDKGYGRIILKYPLNVVHLVDC